MQKKKGPKRAGRKGETLIERWTIERLDHDAGMARVESLPMHAELITKKLLGRLSKNGVIPGMDNLLHWNTKKIKTRRMTAGSLIKTLCLQENESEALSENMVFWIVREGKNKEPIGIYHATQAAKKAAKELYRAVSLKEKGGQP